MSPIQPPLLWATGKGTNQNSSSAGTKHKKRGAGSAGTKHKKWGVSALACPANLHRDA